MNVLPKLSRVLQIASMALALCGMAPGVARAQEPIRVGFIAPLSGPFGNYGLKFLNSVKAYQKIHGDTVAGRKIEVVVRDNSANTPDMAKRLAQELLTRDKVSFLTGFALTPDALAVAPLATQAKTPMVVMLAATSGLTSRSPYVVRVSYSNSQASAPIGTWAARNGIKKVYTLVSDYAPGIDCEEAFKKAYLAGGGEVIGGVRVPLQNLDFAPFVQRLKDANPDAVFVFLPSGEPMVSFMKSFADRGLAQAGMKVLTNTDTAQEFIKPMGDSALSIVNTMHYFEGHESAEKAKYVKAYTEFSNGEMPGAISVPGYDAMAAIYAVVGKLGGNVSDGDKTVEAFKGLKLESPRGQVTIDPDTRDVVQTIYIMKLEKRGDTITPVVVDRFVDFKDQR
jgi:branched-chain amino acid transport system substrate-binding protein